MLTITVDFFSFLSFFSFQGEKVGEVVWNKTQGKEELRFVNKNACLPDDYHVMGRSKKRGDDASIFFFLSFFLPSFFFASFSFFFFLFLAFPCIVFSLMGL